MHSYYHSTPPSATDRALGGLQRIGRLRMSANIVILRVIGSLILLAAIAIATMVRKGWKAEEASVESASCSYDRRCTRQNGRRRCQDIHTCRIQAEGFDATMHKSSTRGSIKKGDTVTVHFDPEMRNTTATLNGVHTRFIAGFLLFIGIVMWTASFALSHFKKNATVTTVAGASMVAAFF